MPGVHKVINLDDAVVADGYWAAKKAIDQIDITWSDTDDAARNQSDIFEQFASDLDAEFPAADHPKGQCAAIQFNPQAFEDLAQPIQR